MHNRYDDPGKLVTDPERLELINGAEVCLWRGSGFEIVADLEGRTEEFERLRPFLALAAAHLGEMDNTAQRFNRLYCKGAGFPYTLSVVYPDEPYIVLEYWGEQENTQFDVVFEHKNGGFELRSFGLVREIPPDWDKAPATGKEVRGGLLSRLSSWLR